MRRLACLAVFSFLAVVAPAGAAVPAPFGHACTAQHGVRLCPTREAGPGGTVNGVKTFDGVPLDVDVTLPATGDGPFPTIVMLHGYGGDKTDFESSTPEGKSSTVFHYNNNYFAKQGYAVLNYTVRGFGHSCGGGPTATPNHSGDCANGYIRLADSRFEARDAQDLLGKLVDQGITKPGAIGVTGISYGGGQSMELAFLRDRIINPDRSFSPWKSPNGTPLSITASWPRWPWSDLSSSLLPNGRFLDFDNRTAGLSRDPVGVPIQSFINGLFASGQITGYYCGNPPSSPCPNRDFDLPGAFVEVLKGEPVTPDEVSRLEEITADKGGFGLSQLSAAAPAPLLIENGWTDDLFPPAEALRIYNLLRARDPQAAVTLQFGDLGHSRGSNKTKMNQAFNTQGSDFFAARLMGAGTAPAPGSVTAFTQTCPKTSDTPDGGPFTAASWPGLHPGTVSFGAGSAQTVLSTGGALDGPAFDPVPQLDPGGTSDACKTVADQTQPGTAVYTHAVTGSGFTLLGLPTVRANIATTGPNGQLAARLYDVIPGGTERLISRSVYRLLDNQSGPVTFQLHGNGYKFLAGHTVKLELRGQDAPYYRPSNTPFSVQVSSLAVSLPVAERPCPPGALHLSVRPSRVTAGQRRRFGFVVSTRPVTCNTPDVRAAATSPLVPVRGALLSFAGHRVRTDARGRVSVVDVLHRPGRYGARASASGLTGARTTVLVVRARRAPHPRFTG